MASYLYRKTNPVADQISTDLPTLGIESTVWSVADELTLTRAAALDETEKAQLDDYLLNHESGPYVFVSQS